MDSIINTVANQTTRQQLYNIPGRNRLIQVRSRWLKDIITYNNINIDKFKNFS